MMEAIHNTAEAIEKTGISFQLSPEAIVIYQESFDTEQAYLKALHLSDPDEAGMLISYHGRLDVVKFKIAMIYETVKIALQEEDWDENRLFISAETMTQAITTTSYYFRVIAYLIKQNFQMSPYAQKIPKVVKILRENGGQLHARDLQKRMGKLPEGYFQKLLVVGEESGVLRVEEQLSPAKKTMRIVKLM